MSFHFFSLRGGAGSPYQEDHGRCGCLHGLCGSWNHCWEGSKMRQQGIHAVFRYCCSDCSSCQAHAVQMGWATLTIWTTMKYSTFKLRPILFFIKTMYLNQRSRLTATIFSPNRTNCKITGLMVSAFLICCSWLFLVLEGRYLFFEKPGN